MNLRQLKQVLAGQPHQAPTEAAHDIESIAPGLVATVNNLVWQVEAMHDILVLGLPYTEDLYGMAYQNVRGMEPDLIAEKATIQDRQASLLVIYRRAQ